MPRSHSPTKSDWAEKVKALRASLRLSQTSLARKLDIPKTAVVRWEHGIEEPSPHSYINLGNLAGEPSCWYFWKHSGLYRGRLMRVLPAVRLQMRKKGRPDLQIVHAGTGTKLFSKPQLHAIPLLPLNAATYGHDGDTTIDFDRVPPEGLIAAPSHWAPNPSHTSCLRVRGDSMAPVLCEGYIIAIDLGNRP